MFDSRRHILKRPDGRAVRRTVYVLLLALLCYVSVLMVSDADLDDRAVILRYWTLFAAGVSAVVAPHVLLPDPQLGLVQMLNLPPHTLLLRQFRRWLPVVVLLALPALILAFGDAADPLGMLGRKSLNLVVTLAVILGVGLYSLDVYGSIGQRSQEWQEGKRGQLWRRIREHAPLGVDLGVPDGLVPAITATGRVFAAGVVFTVGAALAGRALSAVAAVAFAAAFPVWVAMRALARRKRYDRLYYRTNAFYAEVFRSAGGVRVSDREPIPYASVYWVPRRWRPHAWAGLRQMDRALPLGRFILLGHVLLWVLIYRGAGTVSVAAYLLLFSVAKNAAVYLLASASFAPEPFQVLRQAPFQWAVTRFFVNLRWTMPLLLSLLFVAMLHGGFGPVDVGFWVLVDVMLAAVSAVIVTYTNEGRYRRHYA